MQRAPAFTGALQCAIGATGFEPEASIQNTRKFATFPEEATRIPAHLADDLQFRAVLEAWPNLPSAMRAGILAIVEVARHQSIAE